MGFKIKISFWYLKAKIMEKYMYNYDAVFHAAGMEQQS